MRSKRAIIKSYLELLSEEKNLNYSEEKIEELLNNPIEFEALEGLLDTELYLTKDIIIKSKDQAGNSVKEWVTVSQMRAFMLHCKVVVHRDLRSGRYVWNSFLQSQFELVENNKQTCYMASRGSGKSFFLQLYVSFKMYLLPYFDVCYATNVPKQRKRWMKGYKEIIDENEWLLMHKDVSGVISKSVSWGYEEIEYNKGVLEGTTIGTNPRGGHYNLVCGDDPLRDDKKYTHEFTVDYFQGILKPTTYTKKARYIMVGCVTPDTKIITDKGIEEIGDQIEYNPSEKQVIPFEKQVYGKDGWDKTSKFYVNGKTKTKKITLGCGHELECSLIHPLWACISNRRGSKHIIKKDIQWIQAKDLQIGDKVALKIGTEVYGTQATISEDTAYFYGLYLAEGCVDVKGNNNRITISNRDEYCVNFIKDRYNFISQDEIHHRNSKELVSKMSDYGIEFVKAPFKRVPKKMMLEPKHIQVAFLQGLYDGDGCSYIKNQDNSRNKELSVSLSSTSINMAKDVRAMLLNMGVAPVLDSHLHKGHYTKYGLYIKDSLCFDLYCNGANGVKFMKDIGFRIPYKNKDVSAVSYTNLRTYQGFIWRKVKSIEDSENYTVDFVIPQSHSFLTNGIVSHNTPIDFEDLFHVLMNNKLDKNNRPIGKIELGIISAAGFFTQTYPAFNRITKEVLIPEVWTYEALIAERKRIGELRFNREMMLSCGTSKNSLIGARLFRSCCDSDMQMIQKGEKGKKYIISVDSATSDAPTADYCAMEVFEAGKSKLILRHLIHKKGWAITDPEGGTDDQAHGLYELKQDFPDNLIVVENNNAGVALIQAVKALCAKANEDLNLIEHHTHTVSKTQVGKPMDVNNYIEGVKAGKVIFPADPEDIYTIDSLEKVKNEHLNFGVKQGRTGEVYEALAGHDDIFDAGYVAYKYWDDELTDDNTPMPVLVNGGLPPT